MARSFWCIKSREGPGGRLFADNFWLGNYVAIGWPNLGNISPEITFDELRQQHAQTHPGLSTRQIAAGASTVWRFLNKIQIGDIVLTPNPDRRIVYIGQITGEYTYKENWRDECPFPRRRTVYWFCEIKTNELPQNLRRSVGARRAVCSLNPYKNEILRTLSNWTAEVFWRLFLIS